MVMKKTDSADTFFEMIQQMGELLVEIALMIHLHTVHMGVQRFSFDKINDPDGIPIFILRRRSMHEVAVIGDQVRDPGLFSGASKALEFDFPDVGHESLKEDELDDFQAAVRQIDGPLYPELLFIFEIESQFFGTMADKIGSPLKEKDIIIIYTEKIRGIRLNVKPSGDLIGRQPLGRHLAKRFVG